MRVLFFLASLTLIQTSPIHEEVISRTAEDMDHSIAKRTDEEIFFGNQQNSPRVKKADPDVDSTGLVRALPADKIDNLYQDNNQTVGTSGTDKIEKQEELFQKQELVEHNQPPEDTKLENIKLPKDKEPVLSTLSENDEEDGSGSLEEKPELSYDYLQRLYEEAENQIPLTTDYYSPRYYLNYRRRRDSGGEEDVVKRNHRAKRDLGYEDDFSPSYYPENYQDTSYLGALRKRAVEEALDKAVADELTPLLESYETSNVQFPERNYNSRYLDFMPESSESYDAFPYDDSWESENDFGSLNKPADISYQPVFRSQPLNFLPIKRQALNFVPGIRRRGFNYPHSQEPDSHWGAFVETEKRNEEEAYERLYRLARALTITRPSYRSYWQQENYKKK